jgi:hypothetical protein
MKRTLLITITAMSLLTTRAYSQNIYSAIEHNRDEDVSEKVPTEIIEENVFFNSYGREIEKQKKKLNPKKKVISEERFGQDGKLKARLTYTYDSSGLHSLTRKFESWTKLGYSSETAFYEYDKDWHLIRITDKTSLGQTFQETVLINNEKGNPIQLKLFDGNGNIYGTETAIYDYTANKAYTQVQDSRGNVLSKDTLVIRHEIKSDSTNEYNDKGDLVRSSEYLYEYEYDNFGNWTTMKIFNIVNGRKEKDRFFKRKFKYAH